MNISRYIFFNLLLVIILSAQYAIGQNNTIVKDFNNDKSFDFLVEGMGWLEIDSWDYVLTDSKTGKRWGYASSIGYFGAASFMSTGKTRNELGEGWDVIKTIEDTLINFRTRPDPSLEWVLNADIVEFKTTSKTIFDRVVRYNKKWYPGEPLIAENYTYQLKHEDLRHMEAIDTFDTYYWRYRSHNHKDDSRTLDQIDVDGSKFYKTKHALIEFDQGSYAWIFMSGVNQTGGPSKLRWPSIVKVVKQDDMLFLQQSVVVGEYSYWIGDLKNGFWARINNNKMEDWADFKIKGDELIISNRDGGTTHFSIDEINNEIENLQ